MYAAIDILIRYHGIKISSALNPFAFLYPPPTHTQSKYMGIYINYEKRILQL